MDALLREQDELELMEFSDLVREIVPFTNQKKRIENGIDRVQEGEATALYDAVYLASKRLAGDVGCGWAAASGGADYRRRRYGEGVEVYAGAGAGAAGGGDGVCADYCADLCGCGQEYRQGSMR